MVYSGIIATSGTGNVTAIPPQTGQFFKGGNLWNSGTSPAGQWSIDNGTTWVDFDVAPFGFPMPPGFYVFGVLIRRARGSDSGASEADVTSVKVELA